MAKYISKLINGEELYYLKDDEARANKADKASTVSTIQYDTTNKKLTKTINETTSDVVTAADIIADGGVSQMINNAKSEIKGTATSACDTLGDAEMLISAEQTRAQTAESALSSGKADKATTLAGYGITDAYTKSETYTKTEVNGLVDTPHQEYVTVDAYASLPATGSKDTIYRVSNYNGSTSQVDASVYSEYAWDGTQYIFLCVKSQIGEVFDITVYNNNTKYADLASALGTDGANVPESLRKGGMSVKYVQTYDNKYVQCRYVSDSTTTADFTNEANWELDVTKKDLGEIQDKMSKEVKILLTPTSVEDNKYVRSGDTGTVPQTHGANTSRIEKYSVIGGSNYEFSALRSSTFTTAVVLTWIDADGFVLRQDGAGVQEFISEPVTAPNNAVEVWMNVYTRSSSYFNLKAIVEELIDIEKLETDVQAMKKKIRMLIIGNSYSQDAFAYVPFILKNMGVNVSIQIGILMKSSSSINDHINEWNASASDRSHKGYKFYFHNGGDAWANLGDYNTQDTLDDYVWDIIVLQPWHKSTLVWSKYQPAFNQLVNLISDYVAYPVKFAIHQIPTAPASSNGISSDGDNMSDDEIISSYEDRVLATKLLMEGGEIDGNTILPTVCEAIIPIGTAIQNARTISSLKAMGYYAYHQNNSTNYGYLCSIDGIHLQEGLPCQIAAYTVVLSLLDIYGFKERSVIGETTRVTDAWEEGKSIPGQHPSSVSMVNNFDRLKPDVTVDSVCIGSTDANSLIAQKCAIMAVKRPYEVTDMNYIVNPTQLS